MDSQFYVSVPRLSRSSRGVLIRLQIRLHGGLGVSDHCEAVLSLFTSLAIRFGGGFDMMRDGDKTGIREVLEGNMR